MSTKARSEPPLGGIHAAVVAYLKGAAVKRGDTELADAFANMGDHRVARMIFSNMRAVEGVWHGLRLSKTGLEIMRRYFQSVEVAMADGKRLSHRNVLYLDGRAKMPYYASGEGYTLFETKLAISLKLAEGCVDTLREMDGALTEKRRLTE